MEVEVTVVPEEEAHMAAKRNVAHLKDHGMFKVGDVTKATWAATMIAQQLKLVIQIIVIEMEVVPTLHLRKILESTTIANKMVFLTEFGTQILVVELVTLLAQMNTCQFKCLQSKTLRKSATQPDSLQRLQICLLGSLELVHMEILPLVAIALMTSKVTLEHGFQGLSALIVVVLALMQTLLIILHMTSISRHSLTTISS